MLIRAYHTYVYEELYFRAKTISGQYIDQHIILKICSNNIGKVGTHGPFVYYLTEGGGSVDTGLDVRSWFNNYGGPKCEEGMNFEFRLTDGVTVYNGITSLDTDRTLMIDTSTPIIIDLRIYTITTIAGGAS